MYNKKCKSTFLFLTALLSLFTLIVPFMGVGFLGEVTPFLKVLYYIFIVIFAICLVSIILLGVSNLFRNNFSMLPFQELLAFIALFTILLNFLIFTPILNVNLTVGYSILAVEVFVMSCFDSILKLSKKTGRLFKNMINAVKERKQAEKEIEQEKERLEKENENVEINLDKFIEENEQEILLNDKVEIIPPDDDIV